MHNRILGIIILGFFALLLPHMGRAMESHPDSLNIEAPIDGFDDYVIGGDTIAIPSSPRQIVNESPLLLLDSSNGDSLYTKTMKEMQDTNRNWWHLMWKGKLNMKDTTVEYPRFVKFCVDVYNLGDRIFSTYDTTYVVGTGRRWKTRIYFDIWGDSYNMNIGGKMPITLISNPYASAAVALQYMAVGISYSVDLNNLMFNKPVNHQKFEFSFNCARFNLDMAFNKTTGGSYIRTFGDYKRGKLFKEYMPGVKMTSFQADLYYYFNNFKYANGAAYNFSKIQKKNAGSFILGFTYSNEDISMDFTTLPDYLKPFMTVDDKKYRFHYFNYCLLFGYGFNWVCNKHLLYNISVMPSIGVLHCYEDSYDGSAKLLSLNLKARTSLTYNHGDFFTCLIGKIDGHWYKTGKLSVFSAIENVSLSVGIRF